MRSGGGHERENLGYFEEGDCVRSKDDVDGDVDWGEGRKERMRPFLGAVFWRDWWAPGRILAWWERG
jgi:hypothetical protein